MQNLHRFIDVPFDGGSEPVIRLNQKTFDAGICNLMGSESSANSRLDHAANCPVTNRAKSAATQ